jgi:Kef-type K+ transport system membrane component KefB
LAGSANVFFHQPLAVGEIAAGIILGPSVFGAMHLARRAFNAPDIGDLPADHFPKSTQTSMQLLGKLGLDFPAVPGRDGI